LVDEDRITKRAANRDDKFLQTITKAREDVEKMGDRETVTKFINLYDATEDKISAIERREERK